MSNFSEENDFDDIMERLLSRIDDSLDKREGSIIYDALAPAAAELAQCYITLDVYNDQTYLLTASDENLDNRVADFGITRKQATYAQRKITVYDLTNQLMDIDIGSRFSTPNEYGGINFTIISKEDTGIYIAQCETSGSVGNEYVGDLLPLQSINNLGIATLGDNYKPAEDEETDDELRQRALEKINQESFSGNKSAYEEFTKNIDGIEKCRVFPVWNGGGTVKIAIISTDNTIPSATFVNKVQQLIDPINNQGEGIGIAPIGHKVTVVAPTKFNIDISATIIPDTGYTVDQLKESIINHIKEYIADVQKDWETSNTLIIYTSKLIASILAVTQVKNVTNLKINNQTDDLTITITPTEVNFPMLNEVVLNEN